jgi:hypothetical protein
MFSEKKGPPMKDSTPTVYQVPIDIAPGLSPDRIDMIGTRSRDWNINTLTLLSRAGIVELEAIDLPPTGESSVAASSEETSTPNYRTVRVLDPTHLKDETWQQRVEPVRKREYEDRRHNLMRMLEILRGDRCVGSILAETYTLELPGSGQVSVGRSCGGCHACRERGRGPYVGGLPIPSPPWAISRELKEPLASLFHTSDVLGVFGDEIGLLEYGRLLRWLIAMGVRNVVIPSESSELRKSTYEVLRATPQHAVFLSSSFEFPRAPRVPTLIVHGARSEVPTQYLLSIDGQGIPRVLLLPSDAIDPRATHRLLRHVLARKFRFEELMDVAAL